MRKHQLTKAEIEYKTSTKTLEEMLAKLMNTDDLASTNQGMKNLITIQTSLIKEFISLWQKTLHISLWQKTHYI